ncbi:hypothetical protein ABL78_0901 [Leptomonas seymouri]|uniref:ER-Golgi trafficking TRAPP I complex 85 kDa subunit family protein n=1 Tax=Leptomonas seymouri TaxID=5684 RepID=A0A0N1PGA2_LEPSE|nr:hypothetical protein ABL78_0901 [Leptomonas seymouri]|eukprot:KPI90041.1 hypothetical protein ABL78_0901 [Leptomonas seymouri]
MSSHVHFDEWVEQRYTRPVVLLESSAAADAICARHGLDVVQLLRPHGVYTGGPLSSRTGDRSDPITCSKFGVRLMRTDCVRDVAFAQITQHVRSIMGSSAAMDMVYGEQLDGAIKSIVEGGRSRHDGSLPHPIRATSHTPTASALSSASVGGPSPPSTLLERAFPSWHPSFIRDFHSLMRCSSFDTVDHPVGALFAVATSEAGGVEGILQVFRAQAKRVAELKASLPGMDKELHQYYLILHDITATSSPSLGTARQVLTAVQQLYGANYCALIKVNSVLHPRMVKNLDPALWVDASPAVMDVPSAHAVQGAAAAANSAHFPSPSSSSAPAGPALPMTAAATSDRSVGVPSFRTVSPTCGTWPNSSAAILTGCYMSPEDVTEVHNVMAYYLSQSLFKYIERRLRMLDVSVQERRTTTLGKMAAWFKGKDEVRPRTADVVYPPNGSDPSVLPTYVASSVEMQMRHCGDLSLVLHDYEGAIAYYRLCIEELLETLSQRPYNRAMIAACQEGVGVAQLLLRRAPQPSLTPWYTGVTPTTHRISSQTNRLELAWNDYAAAGTQAYAIRVAFLIYEFCRTRLPPLWDRCRAILVHVLRNGVLQRQHLLTGVVNDMLAGISVFSNAPFAAGLAVPPPIPRDYPMLLNLRRFAHYLQQAGAFYRADNAPNQALRCFLRVLEMFRLIDPDETWKELAEHLYITVGQLYTKLGQDVRGIAMTSAAVAQGTPLYRRPDTAQQAFEAFWAQQKHVLSNMGYALCPHMPMPRIVRASFRVDRNYYNTDATTDEVARKMSEAIAEAEWCGIEKQLKKTYTEAVLKSHPQYRFPLLHGGFHSSSSSMSANAGGAGKVGWGHGCRRAAGAAGSSSPTSMHCKSYDYIFADPVAPGDPLQAQRHYTIARAEPLVLSFVMENTVGCPIEATDLTLLYLSYSEPDQLWKSSTTQTVKLDAGARQRVLLSFDPLTEGEYAIIGLCWSLMGQEGYYYFATRESLPGCPESLYEYAIEHPMPTLNAVENIRVTVQPSKACVTATLRPPLPDHLYDGEYFHTKLVVHNTSTKQDATHVFLQRSPTTAHLMYIEECGIARNLNFDAPLVLADHLKAQETRTFTVTIRGQHRRGDVSLQSSGNYIFMLLAYLPGTPQECEKRLELSQQAQLSASGAGGKSVGTTAAEPAPANGGSSPTLNMENQPLSSSPTVMVRLHRLLRRCDVQPVLAMFSTVLPPANASLKIAMVLTVKNICTSQPHTRPSSAGAGAQLPPRTSNDAARAIAAGAATDATSQRAHETGSTTATAPSSYTPLRIARVLAVHSSRWGIECNGTEELVADRATQCLLAQGDSLTFALLVKRRPRGSGAADMTARHLFLSRAEGRSPQAVSPYTDTTCLPIEKALPSPSRMKSVEGCLGTTVSQSERNFFFLQTSYLGPGHIGVQRRSEETNGGLAFYADKAGQQEKPKSEEERRRDEVAEERRHCGAAMEQYTPLALAVSWVREGSDGLRKGQLFLFVDPMEHIYQTLAQQQKRQADQEATTHPQPAAAAASVEQMQQELCEAMLVRYSSLKPWQGAVVSHVHVPPIVRAHSRGDGGGTACSPAAEIPVTLRCMSLSPVPLLVTAEALPPVPASSRLSSPSSPLLALAGGLPNTSAVRETQLQNAAAGPPSLPTPAATVPLRSPLPLVAAAAAARRTGGEVPVSFAGKTVHTFLLMPSEEFEVKFTAYALRPGIVDCQRVTLHATSICFLHGNGDTEEGDEGTDGKSKALLMRTGMTLPSLVRALLERRAPSSTTRTVTPVSFTQQLADNGNRGGREEDALERWGPGNGSGSSNLSHWKVLSRSPRGLTDAAVTNSMTTFLGHYGARAMELLQQLSPRGPAASATVCQIIPQTTPALARVVLDDTPLGAATSTAAFDSTDGTSVKSSASLAHTREAARKLFHQLEVFESGVLRAAQTSGSASNCAPADPFLQLYVYRPTVRSVGTASTGLFPSNNSLAMTKLGGAELPRASAAVAPVTPASVEMTSSISRSPPSAPPHVMERASVSARPAPAAVVQEKPSSGIGTAVASVDPAPHTEAPDGETEAAATATPSALPAPHTTSWESPGTNGFPDTFMNVEGSYEHETETEDGGDPLSPMRIPSVVFKRHAAETLDIDECSSTSGSVNIRKNVYQGGRGGVNADPLDSELTTSTLTEIANRSLSPAQTCDPDLTDAECIEGTKDLAHRHVGGSDAQLSAAPGGVVQLSPAPRLDPRSSSGSSSSSPDATERSKEAQHPLA